MGFPQDYSIDNAIKDIATGKYDDVTFTESGGLITERSMDDGGSRVQINEPVDSEKGHISADYYYDSDGNYTGYSIHNG